VPDGNARVADILFKDGRKNRRELYHGSGYLSQRSRNIVIHDQIAEIRITNFDGSTETAYTDR
jgi:hypothetical protein